MYIREDNQVFMEILKIDGVTKTYGKLRAVDNVDISIEQGEIFGLLGPNGAGKTSLIRMITTITFPDEGTIYFEGEKLNSNHPARIGYLPEERGLYKKMKVGEHLLYLAQLKGLDYNTAKKKIGGYLEKFAIQDWWNKKVEELSKGMQQKIQFISTILHNPKLIILDEPFSGLDPINTNLFKKEIRELNANGTTVIFSTHRMEQVEEICERIVLIHKGKNILEGNVRKIKEERKEGIFRIEFDGKLPADLNGHFEVIRDADHELLVRIEEGLNANDLLRELLGRGFIIRSFNELLPSLNEIFIHHVETGKDA